VGAEANDAAAGAAAITAARVEPNAREYRLVELRMKDLLMITRAEWIRVMITPLPFPISPFSDGEFRGE
jgi:hypothetical protein